MSSSDYSTLNSYDLGKKELNKDYNFMMCTICTTYPVFYTVDSYTEHVRTFHSSTSKSITDKEVDLYSSYSGKKVHTKTTEPCEHSLSKSTGITGDTDLTYTGLPECRASPSYSDSFSYETTELKKGLQRAGELLASVRRKQQLYGMKGRTGNEVGKGLPSDQNYKDRQVLDNRDTALMINMKSVQTDLSKLQGESFLHKTNFESLQEEMFAKTSQLSIHEKHIKELQQQVQQLNETMTKTQTNMVGTQLVKSSTCDNAKDVFIDKSVDLKTDVNNQVLDEKVQDKKEREELEALLILKVNEVKKLENEKELLNKDCDLFYKNMITKYENLKKDYVTLQNQHNNADQNQSDNGELIEELKASLFQELEHSKSIQDQQIKTCKEIEKLQNLLLEREQEIAQIKKASDLKASEISDLKNRLKKDSGSNTTTLESDLDTKAKELVDIQNEYSNQCSELTYLKTQLTDLDSVKSELKTTTKEFEDLKIRYCSQNSEIDELKAKLQEDASKSLARIKDLREQLDQKYDLISDLSNECKFKDTKINEFNDLLKRNIDSYTKDRSEMKKDLIESSEKVKKLKQTIRDLEKENNDLEEEKTALKIELTSNRIEMQQVEVYIEEIKLLKKEKAELEQRCFELRNQLDQRSDERNNRFPPSTNHEDIDDLQERFDSLKKELDEKSAIPDDDFFRLNNEKSKLEDIISEKEKVINDLRHEIKSLQSVLNEKERLCSEIKKKSDDSFQEKLNEKDCVIVDLTNELEKMTNDLELNEKKIEDLTTELCNTSKRSIESEKKNDKLESNLQSRNKELNDLKNAQLDQSNKESEMIIQLQNDLTSKNDEIKELKRLLNEQRKSSHEQEICAKISKTECHKNTESNTDIISPNKTESRLNDEFLNIADGKIDASIDLKDKNEISVDKEETNFEIEKESPNREIVLAYQGEPCMEGDLHKIPKDMTDTNEVIADKDQNGCTDNHMDGYDSDTSFDGSSSSSGESDSELEVDDKKKEKNKTVVDFNEDDQVFVPKSSSTPSIHETEMESHNLSTEKKNLGSDFSDFDSDDGDYKPRDAGQINLLKSSGSDLNLLTNGQAILKQQCENEKILTELSANKADKFEKPKSVFKRQNATKSNKISTSCDEVELPMSDRGDAQTGRPNSTNEAENSPKKSISSQDMKSDNSDFDSDSDDEFYEATSKAVAKSIHSPHDNQGSNNDDFSDFDSDSDFDDDCTSVSQIANTKEPQEMALDKDITSKRNRAGSNTESGSIGNNSIVSLPPLSVKTSSSLLGALPPLSPKPSTINNLCEDGQADRTTFKTSKTFFLTTADDNESDEEVFSDFEDEEARSNSSNSKHTASKNGIVDKNNIDAKNDFGDLPPLRGKQSSLQSLSPKNSSACLPPISQKTSSSASLLGDLPSLSLKPSTSSQICKEEQTDSSLFKKTSSTFSFKADGGDESDDADECAEEECIEEELSDFDDDDIALILENL